MQYLESISDKIGYWKEISRKFEQIIAALKWRDDSNLCKEAIENLKKRLHLKEVIEMHISLLIYKCLENTISERTIENMTDLILGELKGYIR